MSGIVIRLAGVEQPETRVFNQKTITVGTSASCDLSFRDEGFELPHSAVLLTLESEDVMYRISTMHEDSQIIRDGDNVAVGDAIRDGDTFNFGATGVRLRFFFLSPELELAESLQLGTAVLARRRTDATTLSSKRTTTAPRTDVAIVFVKQLIRELVAEIPKKLLFLIAGLVALTIGTIIYINVLNFLEARKNRRLMGDVTIDVGKVRQEVLQMKADLLEAQKDINKTNTALSLPAEVVGKYGSGVCLVYGIYTYVDPRSGREARYRDNSNNSNLLQPNGDPNIAIDGNGPASDIEFIGTGFHVAAGVILTNRHVVQPWDDDPVNGILRNSSLRPRLKELLVYFPKVKQPFVLHTSETSAADDVALCTFAIGDIEPEMVPVLPLDESTDAATASGQAMVLIGYPAGIDGLLAKVDDKERRGLSLNRRSSLKAVLNDLAGRGLIRPLTTQGHISDLLPRSIVHDAQTADGGSGGPIFGTNGKVIGINKAVLDNSPAKFGVPIKYGTELLTKHRATLAAAVPQ